MCDCAWHDSQAGSHQVLLRAKVSLSALHAARAAVHMRLSLGERTGMELHRPQSRTHRPPFAEQTPATAHSPAGSPAVFSK